MDLLGRDCFTADDSDFIIAKGGEQLEIHTWGGSGNYRFEIERQKLQGEIRYQQSAFIGEFEENWVC